jgi:hypothetical protein
MTDEEILKPFPNLLVLTRSRPARGQLPEARWFSLPIFLRLAISSAVHEVAAIATVIGTRLSTIDRLSLEFYFARFLCQHHENSLLAVVKLQILSLRGGSRRVML